MGGQLASELASATRKQSRQWALTPSGICRATNFTERMPRQQQSSFVFSRSIFLVLLLACRPTHSLIHFYLVSNLTITFSILSSFQVEVLSPICPWTFHWSVIAMAEEEEGLLSMTSSANLTVNPFDTVSLDSMHLPAFSPSVFKPSQDTPCSKKVVLCRNYRMCSDASILMLTSTFWNVLTCTCRPMMYRSSTVINFSWQQTYHKYC